VFAAACCPQPPLLVPELGGAPAGDARADESDRSLARMRTACTGAVGRLLAAGPDVVVVIGTLPERTTGARDPVWWPGGATGSLTPWGVAVAAGRPDSLSPTAAAVDGTGDSPLPLSLVLGAWLLDQVGSRVRREYVGVSAAYPPDRCAALGREVAARSGGVGLLVMADGSACRVPDSPVRHDPRAVTFDDAVTRALATADRSMLAGLDATVAADLGIQGRAAWQVAAAATAAAPRLAGRLWYHGAPFGVGYAVATWSTSSDASL